MKIGDVFNNIPELRTERTIIRKFKIADLQDMFEYCSDDEVAQYTTWNAHRNILNTEEFLHYVLRKYENNEVAPWGIEDRKSGKLIGSCGFVSWEPEHSKAELGYVLSKEYWGRGYITESVGKVIEYGFESMLLERIEAKCHPDNIGSFKVMEKVGMTYEGILRSYIYVKGKHQDVKMYSITKKEFESKFGKGICN